MISGLDYFGNEIIPKRLSIAKGIRAFVCRLSREGRAKRHEIKSDSFGDDGTAEGIRYPGIWRVWSRFRFFVKLTKSAAILSKF